MNYKFTTFWFLNRKIKQLKSNRIELLFKWLEKMCTIYFRNHSLVDGGFTTIHNGNKFFFLFVWIVVDVDVVVEWSLPTMYVTWEIRFDKKKFFFLLFANRTYLLNVFFQKKNIEKKSKNEFFSLLRWGGEKRFDLNDHNQLSPMQRSSSDKNIKAHQQCWSRLNSLIYRWSFPRL